MTKAIERERWDAVVIGAGPAGSLTALLLARAGASTLLVDAAAFPRPKVCGACLNRRALRALDAAGVGSIPAALGAVSLRQVRLFSRGRTAELPVGGGAALSREALDDALARAAAAAGATFVDATRAALGEPAPGGRIVRLRSNGGARDVTARVVVVAAGLGGCAAARFGRDRVDPGSRLGANASAGADRLDLPPGTVAMACAKGGYLGAVRVEDGRIRLAAALDAEFVRRAGGLGPAVEAIAAEAGLPTRNGLADLAWRGAPLLTRRPSRVAVERVFVVGDAAGYVEPFTGEGIGSALESARALAPLARRAATEWDPELAVRWRDLHRAIVVHRQATCRGIADLLRRPGLSTLAVRALGRAPAMAYPLLRRLTLNRS